MQGLAARSLSDNCRNGFEASILHPPVTETQTGASLFDFWSAPDVIVGTRTVPWLLGRLH